uniref:AlNc14C184G8291 protein n=1 Tax=Albugo laibachii Nc14 TaxID=890382 RepID=F0WPE7_9STRA|nr:AlNc14C184G8291 [Albugo laibachii Nc14]|eukprot:CCA23194.1 AlNc14C184G8291 [Albugo laibachii Nc14]
MPSHPCLNTTTYSCINTTRNRYGPDNSPNLRVKQRIHADHPDAIRMAYYTARALNDKKTT